ncbi:MAG: helix-turn-helix domain-containing protein [Gemmataceae bacterium]
MARLTFTEEEQQALHRERYEHPHPRVPQRIEVLWLISQGLVYAQAASLAGVSEATVDRYVAVYRQGGLDALREWKGHKAPSELLEQGGNGHRTQAHPGACLFNAVRGASVTACWEPGMR